ncbi:MAG: conjugative transposon protein TraN [Flavobacteriaceae bacterium]|nr:conjugative transposon protein TraN [Flavobacteriaceae bacterium]
MKFIVIFSGLLLCIQSLSAQTDTLYINETHTLALVFPEPITRAVTGHPNYQFGYDTVSPGRLGLLQGHPGTASNLLVLTDDSRAYSFALVYRKRLQEGHRFVKEGESIGSVGTEIWLDPLGQGKNHSTKTSLQSNSIQYRKASTYFLEKSRIVLRSKCRDGIILRLQDMAYYGTETYLIMEIENRSDIDFEVDFVQLFIVHGNPRKRSSYQKLGMEPVYRHQMPLMVKTGHKQRFVYVVPKFTLGHKEKLLVELREKRGSRIIRMAWD